MPPRKSGGKKPTRRFWVPPSTPDGGPKPAASKPAKKPEKPARKFWTPAQLGFSERQEYGVDGVEWSSEEVIEIKAGLTVTAIWYGRPICGVSVHDWLGHHATAVLPGVIEPTGGSHCVTCEWQNLGNPKTCLAAIGVYNLLMERTSDRPPF